MKSLIAALALAIPFCALAQPTATPPLPARTQAEIDHLFAYIAGSGCKFNRNGSWHDMTTARSHVNTKYEYLVERGMIDSAEAFIDKAASQSSFSGKDYLVQCPGSEATPSAGWLKTELNRFRHTKS